MDNERKLFSLDSARKERMTEILDQATTVIAPILQDLGAPPYEIEHNPNSTVRKPVLRLKCTLANIPKIQRPSEPGAYPSTETMANDISLALTESDTIEIGDGIYKPLYASSDGEDILLFWEKN